MKAVKTEIRYWSILNLDIKYFEKGAFVKKVWNSIAKLWSKILSNTYAKDRFSFKNAVFEKDIMLNKFLIKCLPKRV